MSKINRLGNQFSEYLLGFMERAQMLPTSKRALVAVSAGRDSMLLLYVLSFLRDKGVFTELKGIHINHGTRTENDLEAQQVLSFAQSLNVLCHVEMAGSGLGDSGNFEKKARIERYRIFNNLMQRGDFLYTAHHIDDSFEWSMLSGLKSSSLKSRLGIPAVNGKIARPFMCITRAQINSLVKKLNIPYMEDPSNQDCRFERNFVRHKIIPRIRERFPRYLKHYVFSSNDAARAAGLSCFTPINCQSQDVQEFSDRFGGVTLVITRGAVDFSAFEERIISIIKRLSGGDRGVLRSQVQKMIRAAESGKRGPLSFSGGVKGYMAYGALYFIHNKNLIHFEEYDRETLEILEKSNKSKISQTGEIFPFLVFSSDQSNTRLLPSVKRTHPLLPRSTKYAIENQIWFNAMYKIKFYEKKGQKQKNRRIGHI